jgi:hypothetical protein
MPVLSRGKLLCSPCPRLTRPSKGRFTHSMPRPCRAGKGLEYVFPIWFTQCGCVWFTLAMPMPCSDNAVLLKATARPSRDGRAVLWPWEERHGMASVNQTQPHCLNQMGKTHSKPLPPRHGRGTACYVWICLKCACLRATPCGQIEAVWFKKLQQGYSIPLEQQAGDLFSPVFYTERYIPHVRRWQSQMTSQSEQPATSTTQIARTTSIQMSHRASYGKLNLGPKVAVVWILVLRIWEFPRSGIGQIPVLLI